MRWGFQDVKDRRRKRCVSQFWRSNLQMSNDTTRWRLCMARLAELTSVILDANHAFILHRDFAGQESTFDWQKFGQKPKMSPFRASVNTGAKSCTPNSKVVDIKQNTKNTFPFSQLYNTNLHYNNEIPPRFHRELGRSSDIPCCLAFCFGTTRCLHPSFPRRQSGQGIFCERSRQLLQTNHWPRQM